MKQSQLRNSIIAIAAIGLQMLITAPPEYLGMVWCWAKDRKKKLRNHARVVIGMPGKHEPTEK